MSKFRRARVGVIGCLASLVAAACASGGSDGSEQVGEQRAAVELHDVNRAYGFAFVPPAGIGDSEALDAFARRLSKQSFPIQGTGAVIAPYRDSAGNQVLQNGVPVRFTCGATLVSPSYVITAGHCVDTDSFVKPTDTVDLELYRPTPKLADEAVWRPKTQLSGSYPSYTHTAFTADDGYLTDRYSCTLVSRCYGTNVNCPGGATDEALLHCDGRPGDRYGYLNVAKSENPAGSEIFVPWKHEVYDIAPDITASSDQYVHYVQYPTGTYGNNYHYLDRNQLLPLMSTLWPDGSPRTKVTAPNSDVVWTDALGCHGTSGSGFLQQNATTGAWELLGPTALGGSAFSSSSHGSMLCEHDPGVLDQFTPAKGSQQLGYSSLTQTQSILTATSDWMAECAAQPDGMLSLGGRTGCQATASGLSLGARVQYRDFNPWSSPVLTLPVGTVGVGSVKVKAGTTYRVSVSGVPAAGCSGGVCPELFVRVGGQQVLHQTLSGSSSQPMIGAALYVAASDATLPVMVEARGASFELGDASVRPNHRVSSFDTAYEREEAALLVPARSVTRAMPMRFTGDGAQGFAALFYPGERFVLSRQGLGTTGNFDFAFSATPAQTLRCGLLASDGTTLISADCGPNVATRLSYAGTTPAVAAFIEGAAVGGTQLDNVSIDVTPVTSDHCIDAARDADESDVDCGGSCGGCSNGKLCNVAGDCASALCSGGVCVCPAETDAQLCSRLGANCGAVGATDNCGTARSVSSCGACTSPNTCGGGGTANLCGKPACVPETDAQLCSRIAKNCGAVTATDNCGTSRSVTSCGSCTSPNTCGGGGTANVCGKPACTPETNAQFCSRLAKNCGAVSAADNCGTARSVSTCGSCTSPNTCGGGGTANVCGSSAPACLSAYAQGNCLTYFQGVKVSSKGHNWLCSNGNCANCATFASCAPGGTGCPWGVVWTDQGVCK